MHSDDWLPDFDDPDDLTPAERLERIVRILARGAIRLAEEEHGGATNGQAANSPANGFEHAH